MAGIFGLIGGAVGAVAGYAVGGPAGAAVGTAIGNIAGSAIDYAIGGANNTTGPAGNLVDQVVAAVNKATTSSGGQTRHRSNNHEDEDGDDRLEQTSSSSSEAPERRDIRETFGWLQQIFDEVEDGDEPAEEPFVWELPARDPLDILTSPYGAAPLPITQTGAVSPYASPSQEQAIQQFATLFNFQSGEAPVQGIDAAFAYQAGQFYGWSVPQTANFIFPQRNWRVDDNANNPFGPFPPSPLDFLWTDVGVVWIDDQQTPIEEQPTNPIPGEGQDVTSSAELPPGDEGGGEITSPQPRDTRPVPTGGDEIWKWLLSEALRRLAQQEAAKTIEDIARRAVDLIDWIIDQRRRQDLINELSELSTSVQAQGGSPINFSPGNIVNIVEVNDGDHVRTVLRPDIQGALGDQNPIVWLETGKGGKRGTGLQHILEREEETERFAGWGIPKEEIADVIIDAIQSGNALGTDRGRDEVVFDVTINGERKYVAILIADNGYIVTAHPVHCTNIITFSDVQLNC